jgi:hypothetical protein
MTEFIGVGALVPGTIDLHNTNADHKVRDIRTKLYRQMPNEQMLRYPLTKMVLGSKGRFCDRAKVEWGMEAIDPNYVAVTGVYNDTGLSDQIISSDTVDADATVYVKMAEADAKRMLVNEEIEIRHLAASGLQTSINLDITAVTLNGASSYLTCKTMSEDNTDAVLSNTSLLQASMLSYAAPTNFTLPAGRYTEATIHFNYAQILAQALSISGSEMADKSLFDESNYDRYMRQTMDRFHAQFEHMIKFGTRKEGTATITVDGASETVKRYRCGGLKWAHRTLGGNFLRIPEVGLFEGYDFTGKTWEQGGYTFLKLLMNRLSKKSGSAKKVLTSSTGRLIVNDMFESMTNVTIGTSSRDKWGFDVEKISGMNCEMDLLQDAGLSLNPAWESTMFIVEPSKIEFRPRKGRDMTVIRSKKDAKAAIENGWTWRDGIKEGVFIDGVVTYDDLDGMAVIEGIGQNFKAS